MAKKSMILKQQREPKFSSRQYNRCKLCGRPHAYLRNYGVCRICFRELAYKGEIPGVRKRFFALLSRSWRASPLAISLSKCIRLLYSVFKEQLTCQPVKNTVDSIPVSYTHLDVYKRQVRERNDSLRI